MKYPWSEKLPIVFWRGADSGISYGPVDVWSNLGEYYPRMELIRLSMKYPDKIDAAITSFTRPSIREVMDLK
jgi:hypothetical protein